MARYDVPEPEWWRHARYLKSIGFNKADIAEAFGKNESTIRYILDEKRREKINNHARPRPKYDPVVYDGKRKRAREEARRRWRQDGRKRELKRYYRELDCL